jgi:hypothetical protein
VQRLPGVRPVTESGDHLLERIPAEREVPTLVDAPVVEDATLRARPVPGPPEVGFAAFLDGVQESRVIGWDRMAPIVFGGVAAAVRARVGRRLVAWRAPVVERRLYVPLPYVVREDFARAFDASRLVDTATPDADGCLPAPHPFLLLERAKHAVSRDRDRVEQRLAEEWCVTEQAPLFIDGGIGGSETVARASCAVGVIKSHRTLWAEGGALERVLALRAGERSSVIRISPRGRSAVLSWYLRLRDPAGHDALWGLVRIEVAESTDDATTRADTVSRWVLAEAAPLATPDARWDKMAYGIRNCEEFLRAVC